MKILLLEDDLMLNDAITQYLTSVGHQIVSSKDGKTCLEILENEKFDMLILDINLPDIDGFTILEELHKQKEQFLLYLSLHF